MRKEFYYRLGTLAFLAIAVVFGVGIISLTPAYFLSLVNNASAEKKLKIQEEEPLPVFDEESRQAVEDINRKLALIEGAQKNTFSVIERAIQAVVAKKIPGIRINRIAYNDTAVKGKQISITGTAPSRDVLLQFRQAFEKDVSFTNVELPISNFVKGSNIEFNLNVTPVNSPANPPKQ